MELTEAFQQATGEFITLIQKLDEKELNMKPRYGGWSPGQIGDHIHKSYAAAETMIGRTESTNREPDEKVPAIKDVFTDFTIQMANPSTISTIPDDITTKSMKARLLGSHLGT